MKDSLQLVCPHCLAVNRLPEARLTHKPNCGKCHQPIFLGKPFELGRAQFDKQVHYNDIPVVVDFWAPWCGPCRTMAPAFAQAATALEPKARFFKVNTDEEQELSARYGIRSIPTLVLFKHGKEAARQAGAVSAQQIAHWLAAHE